MKFINSFFNYLVGFIGVHSRYNPIIPQEVQVKMRELGISYPELIGAFNSSNIKPGRKPGSTMGIANYYGRVVGATYKKDDNNPKEWVIIGCWKVDKKSRDFITHRRY